MIVTRWRARKIAGVCGVVWSRLGPFPRRFYFLPLAWPPGGPHHQDAATQGHEDVGCARKDVVDCDRLASAMDLMHWLDGPHLQWIVERLVGSQLTGWSYYITARGFVRSASADWKTPCTVL